MPLIEVKGKIQEQYSDSEVYPHSWWSQKMGIHPDSIQKACKLGQLNYQTVNKHVMIPIAEFPKLIRGLSQLTIKDSGRFHSPIPIFPHWQRIDIGGDFEIKAPTGGRLIWRYF